MPLTTDELARVLIIDDDLGPRESLRVLLKNDFDVLCADSVDAGLRMLESNRTDAVVMDIRMPGKSGIEGLGAIRVMDPSISVIMLTGYSSLETAQQTMRLGANDYIKKPFDIREMEETIRRNVRRTQIERKRKNTASELADLNKELLKELADKDRMAALGQKSAELVHDLRNPLGAILGYVSILEKQLKQSSENLGTHWQETWECVEVIQQSATRCKEYSDTWLGIARGSPPVKRSIPVRKLVEDATGAVRHSALERQVQLNLHLGGGECAVAIDRVQMSRALQNVLVNAIEAVTPHKGRIDVNYTEGACSVTIEVKDNGCGMSQELNAHLFMPFVSDGKMTGTGLGLFITKRVIEDHGGTIRLESAIDKGTTVIISLPIAETRSLLAESPPAGTVGMVMPAN